MTTPSRTKFYRDKQDGKWAGVCSGLADYTGVEALWIRIGFIVLTIAFGWPLLAYIAIAMLAPVKPINLYRTPEEQKFWQGVRANPARGSRDVRASFRELDRRLADIELYYTSRNTRLADEIDALR
jgi:phage shock protein C